MNFGFANYDSHHNQTGRLKNNKNPWEDSIFGSEAEIEGVSSSQRDFMQMPQQFDTNGFPSSVKHFGQSRRLTLGDTSNDLKIQDSIETSIALIEQLKPARTRLNIKGTHFKKEKILDADALDPASYKFLESKTLDRHQKSFLMQSKHRKVDEMTCVGFKPKSQFYRKEANPLDRAPAIAHHPELDKKLKSFYKVPARKFSVSRPIDAKETFIASGGPSSHIISAREITRQKFLSPDAERDYKLNAYLQNDLPFMAHHNVSTGQSKLNGMNAT